MTKTGRKESENEILKVINEILELYKKILEKNNGEIPENMPVLEIETPPFWGGETV